VAISVKETSERLCKIWRIPLNWHRHFLRTEMMKLKQSAQDIDAWMGHAEFGNEAFSKFCGMSLSSLKKLADDINYVLVDDLKIDAKTVSQDD
jgi:hypothetical protein